MQVGVCCVRAAVGWVRARRGRRDRLPLWCASRARVARARFTFSMWVLWVVWSWLRVLRLVHVVLGVRG